MSLFFSSLYLQREAKRASQCCDERGLFVPGCCLWLSICDYTAHCSGQKTKTTTSNQQLQQKTNPNLKNQENKQNKQNPPTEKGCSNLTPKNLFQM